MLRKLLKQILTKLYATLIMLLNGFKELCTHSRWIKHLHNLMVMGLFGVIMDKLQHYPLQHFTLIMIMIMETMMIGVLMMLYHLQHHTLESRMMRDNGPHHYKLQLYNKLLPRMMRMRDNGLHHWSRIKINNGPHHLLQFHIVHPHLQNGKVHPHLQESQVHLHLLLHLKNGD